MKSPQEHSLKPEPTTSYSSLALFGIPISNAPLEKIVDECIQATIHSHLSNNLFHVTAINRCLIAHCYGWWFTTVNNPELLGVVRKANMTVAPSSFLRFIGRLLGAPLSQPVSTSDLLNALCHALGKREKGVFILGGGEKSTKTAAVRLHEDFRGLRLVGIATPLIFTAGEDLVNSLERDALLVEQINASNADLLIVNLGSPKQELWLERVRNQLRVPLVFTVGDAVAKKVQYKEVQKAAPNSPQTTHGGPRKSLGEWIVRGAHNLSDALKIGCMAIPLLVYHTINRSVFQWFYENKDSTLIPKNTQLFLSTERSIAFITLPALIDASNAAALKHRFDEAASHDVLVLNFQKVRHIQPEGFYFLIEGWLKRQQQNKEIYAFCPSSDIKSLLKVHRTWDLFKDTLCSSAEMLMARLSRRGESTAFYDTFNHQGETVVITMLGALDNRIDYDVYLRKLGPVIDQRECAIDLSYCTLIDNSGFAFLLTLRKQKRQQNKHLALWSANKALRRQFRAAKVEDLLG